MTQETAQADDQGFNPDEDRYPSLMKVLQTLPQLEDFPEGPVERVEVYCHASGDATCRVWTPRAEEPWGGYIPAA